MHRSKKLGRSMIAAITAGLMAISIMGAATASRRLQVGNSTVGADIDVLASDGFTPVAFSDADVAFAKVDEASSADDGNPAFIVDLTFPVGVTITGASIDADASACSDEDGTVAYVGNRVSVTDIACYSGESLVVEVDGDSYLTSAGDYQVELTYKVQFTSRNKTNTNMWRAYDADAVQVSTP